MAHAASRDAFDGDATPFGRRFQSWLRRVARKYMEGRTRSALARSARYIEMLSDEQLAEAGLTREQLRVRI